MAEVELTRRPPVTGSRARRAQAPHRRRTVSQRGARAPVVRIRRARSSDLDIIGAILTDGAERARAMGIRGFWPIPFPPERIRESLDRGEVVLLERGGVPVGTLALLRSDPEYWGSQPPVAGYVHRFAVARRWSGERLGDRLLDWAAAEVRRWGRRWLRLDTLARDSRLVRYYFDRGFRLVGRVRLRTLAGPRRLVLLEKDLGPTRPRRAGREHRRGSVKGRRAPRVSPGGSARSRS